MPSAAERSWKTAENILVIRLDNFGDVLMSTPAIRAIKEARPGRKVTLLASPEGALVGRMVPEIDEVISYPAPWVKATSPLPDSKADLKMIAALDRRKFDAAVIFTVYSQNPLPAALMCFLANIPLRLAHCRENPYQLLTNWVPEGAQMDSGRHEVRRQLDLVGTVGYATRNERLSFSYSAGAQEKMLRLAERGGLDLKARWVVMHPGATAPSRRYPPAYFAEAARMLNETGIQVILTGSKREAELAESIGNLSGDCTYSLAGKLDMEELGALIHAAPLLISNNTGPVHLAAALGTPVVDLYALTNPQHTPWMVPNRVLSYDVPCKWCYKSICPEGHHLCLRGVAPEEVVKAALELLTARKKSRTPKREVKA